MKLDVLPPHLAAQAEGQHVTYEKLKAFCETLRSDIMCNDMSGGSSIGTHAKTALMAIQMLWNELDELKNDKICQLNGESHEESERLDKHT